VNIYGTDERIKIGPRKLTRFEIARIVGARALQISMGAPPLLDPSKLPKHVREDPILLAKAELEAGVLPVTVVRYTRRGDVQLIPVQWLIEHTKRAWR
jgi:DNA-directed RNA polymerase I, II, and III subunit RPABC2/DNA-directed RNA polymerase subunit K